MNGINIQRNNKNVFRFFEFQMLHIREIFDKITQMHSEKYQECFTISYISNLKENKFFVVFAPKIHFFASDCFAKFKNKKFKLLDQYLVDLLLNKKIPS